MQAAAGVGPLDDGAIRFTAIQPAGRGASLYEAGRGAAGTQRTIVDLSLSAPGSWTVVARETRSVAAETLDYFIGRIDSALAAPAETDPCGDGTQYYAEHGSRGASGCAADQANAAVARALGLADPVTP